VNQSPARSRVRRLLRLDPARDVVAARWSSMRALRRQRIALLAGFVLAVACGSEPPAVAPLAEAPAPAPPASAALDRLDGRTPVPLLPMMAEHQKRNMRDHLLVVQEIVAGMAAGDFAAVERAAARMGYTEQMGAMCSHMGAGAPGFGAQAVQFHRNADRIVAAARDHDQARVLVELGTTLASCTACHAMWKQRVVDEATWQALTQAPMPGPHPAP